MKIDNVIKMRQPRRRAHPSRAEAARYLCQMTLELEQMANTAGLELSAYFLALARAEAATVADAEPESDPASAQPATPQAPYRAD